MFDTLLDGVPYLSGDKRFSSCPFCSSKDIHHENVMGTRYARCQKCSATGGYVFSFEPAPFTRDEVVKRWNTRAETIEEEGGEFKRQQQ